MQKNGKTIKKIVEAAKYELGKNGFTGTTVESITNKAKVAKGTFYLYFKTKEDVIRYMMSEMVTAIEAIMKEADGRILNGEKDFQKLMRGLIVSCLKEYYKLRNIVQIVYYSNYELSASLSSFKAGQISILIKRIEGLLQSGMDKGLIRKLKTAEISYLLFSMFLNFAIDVIFKEGPKKIEYYVDVIYDFIFNGIACTPKINL